MSNQTNNKSSKPSSDPRGSSSKQSTTDQEPDRKGMNSGKYHVPERMETFPKTNTYPKNWDLSSFSKKQK